MEANRLAEFRVRRREICLIVNSDDRRVGIYSLRGACVAAALRAARHEAQRILFKKRGLQNCNPPFLIFFYFLLFSRYFFHFHIRFMKVEFHTFFRISLCRSRIPTEYFASYGQFHFLYTKRHMQKLLPFSMRPVFSIPDNRMFAEQAFYCFRFRKLHPV